jgi:hypothetical protein
MGSGASSWTTMSRTELEKRKIKGKLKADPTLFRIRKELFRYCGDRASSWTPISRTVLEKRKIKSKLKGGIVFVRSSGLYGAQWGQFLDHDITHSTREKKD